jgi:quinol monooxygenase YgiN
MRQSTPRRRSRLIRVAGPILALFLAATASAQEVIRITSYKPLAGRNAEVSKVTDEEVTGVYAGMKGLKWVKFYYDPATGDRGSVTVWENRAALDTYMNSEPRKGILAKLRPLIQEDVSSRIYVVHQPGK